MLTGISIRSRSSPPIPADGEADGTACVPLVEVKGEGSRFRLLMKEGESVEVETELEEVLTAPVAKDRAVGKILYRLDGEVVAYSEIRTAGSVEKLDFRWCASRVLEDFLGTGRR